MLQTSGQAASSHPCEADFCFGFFRFRCVNSSHCVVFTAVLEGEEEEEEEEDPIF